MAEQERESAEKARQKAVEADRIKQQEIERLERLHYADMTDLQVLRNPEEKLDFMRKVPAVFTAFEAAQFQGVINSIALPAMEQRYIEPDDKISKWFGNDADYRSPRRDTASQMMEIVATPCMYLRMHYIYGNWWIFAWKEDGVWKALELQKSRCPSGGCDGDHVHLLVAPTAEELLEMIWHVKIWPADKDKILAEMVTI